MSTTRRQAIRSFVYMLITENSDFNQEDLMIHSTSPLTKDELGVDSLDMIEVVMALEAKFDIEIKDEAFEKFTTVDDLIAFLDDAIDPNYDFEANVQASLEPALG